MPRTDDNPYAPPISAEPPVLAQPVGEDESVVRVEYCLTLDDLVEFNFFHFSHLPSYRRRLWTMRGMAVALLALGTFWPLYLAAGSGGVELSFFSLASLVGGMVFLAYTLASRRKANLRSALHAMFREGRNANLFSLQRVWLSPQGIRRISRYVDATYQWPAVEKVVAGPYGAYIYDSAASAIIVPHSAFASEAEFQRFLEMARQFQKQAGDGR